MHEQNVFIKKDAFTNCNCNQIKIIVICMQLKMEKYVELGTEHAPSEVYNFIFLLLNH